MTVVQFKNQYIEDFLGYKVYPLEELTAIEIDGEFYELNECTEESLNDLKQRIENGLAFPLTVEVSEDFTEFSIYE